MLRLFVRCAQSPAHEAVDLVGGRIETRRVFLFPEMKDWLDWPYLEQGLAVEKITEWKRTGKRTQEVFFGLTSLPKETPPDSILELFRGHWSIENRVHHVLDCSMGEDACRVRAGTGAAVLGAFRRMALGLMQTIKGKRSLPSTMRYLDANGRILRLCLGTP